MVMVTRLQTQRGKTTTESLPLVEPRRYSWYRVAASYSWQAEARYRSPLCRRCYYSSTAARCADVLMHADHGRPSARRSVAATLPRVAFCCNQPHFFSLEEHGHQPHVGKHQHILVDMKRSLILSLLSIGSFLNESRAFSTSSLSLRGIGAEDVFTRRRNSSSSENNSSNLESIPSQR